MTMATFTRYMDFLNPLGGTNPGDISRTIMEQSKYETDDPDQSSMEYEMH